MNAYIFEHQGKQYTPDGQVNVPDVAAHNKDIEAKEVAIWATKPDKFQGYVVGNELQTFLGLVLGRIVRRSSYRSNFHRTPMESVTIKATNGELYYGRYGTDWQFVRIRKRKTKRIY